MRGNNENGLGRGGLICEASLIAQPTKLLISICENLYIALDTVHSNSCKVSLKHM